MRKTLAVALLFVWANVAFAQFTCGFDENHRKLLLTDPSYKTYVEATELSIRNYIAAHPASSNAPENIYTIPVVVHVLHTGGAVGTVYNPTDATINDAITYLNQVFAGSYTGMEAPVGQTAVANLQIQFALAKRTPSCGYTNGIDRINASSLPGYTSYGINYTTSNGCPESTMKNFARWNVNDYYNIYLVNKIDGSDGTSGQFIAGYAYFPGAGDLDGIVMLATQFQTGRKTLPHEMGHAFNLFHPFEGSSLNTACPDNNDCGSQGDHVCDTDPVTNNVNSSGVYDFTCRTGTNDCASAPYTKNTEKNFMSYTSCFTLFTYGQRDRVQASMALSSRASLVAATNLALTPCGPVVNFAVAADTKAETAENTAGCRKYKDYTYSLILGEAPSANATVTLTLSGTATVGVDYDITTNSNFVSPSMILNFPSGITDAKTFTLRIYDDNSVETSETIIVNLAVNNGGGNLAAGTTTPSLTFTLNDNDIAPAAGSTANYTIGTHDIDIVVPFYGGAEDGRFQFVYTKADLNNVGLVGPATISSIAFQVVSKGSSGAFNNFNVKLKNTSTSSLTGGAFESGATQVYNGSLTTVPNFNNIYFQNNFLWDGSSNLLVDICFDNSSTLGIDYIAGTSNIAGSMFNFGNSTSGCNFTNALYVYTNGGARPVIRIRATTATTEIETSPSATANNYIASSSNEFFYSTSNKLMGRMKNVNATLGCVSNTIEASGTTWPSFLNGTRSAKVFSITPTSNGSTTSYNMELWFTNQELGGKAPSTLSIAKTTATTMDAANAGNTVIVTTTATALGSNGYSFSGNFSGFSKFFLVDQNVALPLSFAQITAKPNKENIDVSWVTQNEQNNTGFDVEVSNNGINFTKIGYVQSKGNTPFEHNYQYVHFKPEPGTYYYRLKQTDIDGKFSYSQIVSAKLNRNGIYLLYPVPATDKVTVNFGKPNFKGSVEILNTELKVISRVNITNSVSDKKIDITLLAKGIYFMRITDERQDAQLLKFIKQ